MTPAEMYAFAGELYPIPRSLTGAPVRETLQKIRKRVPIKRHSVKSGTKVYDWTVPPEWNVEGATLHGPDGLVCSWDDNPLHLMGYSEPMRAALELKDMRRHLWPGPVNLPHAIPYVTSYYENRWGFCLPANVDLPDGVYMADIKTRLDPRGRLDYADLVVPGRKAFEVLFSTYTCHPNLANDNVSGMVVQTALAEWIMSEPRRYTYRFVWCPETIGALVYLSKHLRHLQKNVVAGFVLNFLGDDRAYSMVESRTGKTYADRVGRAAVARPESGTVYDWMARGSDERQYASPLANLPVVRLSRSEHHNFPEYHTSADDMSVISPEGLAGSLEMLKDVVRIIEGNGVFRARFVGDAQLGRRGLYPTVGHGVRDKRYQHVLSLCDGDHDVIQIAERTRLAPDFVIEALQTLQGHGLVGAV